MFDVHNRINSIYLERIKRDSAKDNLIIIYLACYNLIIRLRESNLIPKKNILSTETLFHDHLSMKFIWPRGNITRGMLHLSH